MTKNETTRPASNGVSKRCECSQRNGEEQNTLYGGEDKNISVIEGKTPLIEGHGKKYSGVFRRAKGHPFGLLSDHHLVRLCGTRLESVCSSLWKQWCGDV